MARLHRERLKTFLDEAASGGYAIGSLLPREVDLAVHLGVSRGVAREMVRALEERGVVSVKHGRGATVLPVENWDMLDPIVLGALLASRHRQMIVRELLECRAVIEPEAAGLAAERHTPTTLAAVDEAFAALSAAKTQEGRGLAELKLHRAVVGAADNRPLAQIAGPLLDAMEQLARTLGRRRTSFDEHEAIVGAVRAGDVMRARNAMSAHLRSLLSELQP
jgi:DNA-binding FadR family transcriptional regulator